MIPFNCQCGNILFFENTACVRCGTEVGYDCGTNSMLAIQPENGVRRCHNGLQHQVCNWVVANGAEGELCPACQLNRTIPDLSMVENLENWRQLEAAKRRALHTLRRFNLFPKSKIHYAGGLMFDFLMPTKEAPVLTDHRDGVITVNLREADDSYREKQRHQLGEPYRTLIGHFRHELGHYFWDRFFRQRPEGDPLLQEFREKFGDERMDYATALKQHYEKGAVADWNLNHVSAYATSHPWEDWAETWAQYLHMQDGLESIRAFGWNTAPMIPFTPFTEEDIFGQGTQADPQFLTDLNEWTKILPVVNEMAAGLGHPNFYPFIFSSGNARKLYSVHHTIHVLTQIESDQNVASTTS